MRMNTTISILALGAVVAAFVSPALAQRDTRPETRPTIEKGDGDSDRPVIELRLPKSTRGMQCEIGGTRNGIAYVEVVNDTGKTIKAGSTVTIYTQPGNVQKSFVVEKDWKPGQKLDVPLKGVTLAADAECAVRVSPPKRVETPDTPTEPETPPEEPEAPAPLEPPVPDLGGVNEYETGDTGPMPGFDDPNMVVSANCEVIAFSQVSINNSGNVPWPKGTHIKVTFPNGQVLEFDGDGFVHEGDYGVPNELLWPDGEFTPLTPDVFTCQIEMTFNP